MRLDHGETECELRVKARASSKALLRRMKEHHDFAVRVPRDFKPKPEPMPAPVTDDSFDAAWRLMERHQMIRPGALPMTKVEIIQRMVLREYPKLTLHDMKSPRRDAMAVRARQTAMYLAKQLTDRSLPEIGRRFGGRDHSTILHGIRTIERLVETDPVIAARVKRIKSQVESIEEPV